MSGSYFKNVTNVLLSFFLKKYADTALGLTGLLGKVNCEGVEWESTSKMLLTFFLFLFFRKDVNMVLGLIKRYEIFNTSLNYIFLTRSAVLANC